MTAELVRRLRAAGHRIGRPGRRPAVGFADLVLPDAVNESVHRLVGWARHREQLVADGLLVEAGGSGGGITALFSGSPGTGKTLAAHVVAAELGLDIMRVDLSAIVDKYIGETQKNLERVFHQAESLNVVLFFDEADALFGRRSEVKDAHDRYANQEVAYLLQRMEQFDGITILATNLRGNLDPAFSRRLSFILHFPDPDVPTRSRLWRTHLARLGADGSGRSDRRRPAGRGRGADRRRHPQHRGRRRVRRGDRRVRPGMRHIVAATVGEYSKLGRRVPPGGFHGERPMRELRAMTVKAVRTTVHERTASAPMDLDGAPRRRPTDGVRKVRFILPGARAGSARAAAAPGTRPADELGGTAVPAETRSILTRRRGSGHTLPEGVARRMEAGFGTPLDHVRVHADTEADGLTRQLQATAFTLGSDIYFSRGSYAPTTGPGQRLLAHELAHVAQQSAGPAPAAAA